MTAVKVLVALSLAGAVILSVRAPAPRHSPRSGELARLLGGALALYLVGAIAVARHALLLAGALYACGIVVCGIGAWLSRGRDDREPPRPCPADPDAPPGDGSAGPRIDWSAFDRARARWPSREPAGASRR